MLLEEFKSVQGYGMLKDHDILLLLLQNLWDCGGKPVVTGASGQSRQVPVWLYSVGILMKEVQ